MKRTLCLLLSLLLLVSVLSPAAMAQSDGDIQIICRNWSWDIPVTEFQFEYTMEGATLSEEPCFLYEDENGNLQRETGTLRDIPYVLKFVFQLDDSFPRDYNFVWLNRNCADTKTVVPDGNGGWRMEVQFRVPVYERISEIRVGPGAKPRPGKSIGTGNICTGGVDCFLTEMRRKAPAFRHGECQYDAVVWANASGIVQGVSPTSFSPYRDATRAEALMMLIRL